MKLSSRSQYAITAMLELALHQSNRPVTLFDISQQQKISLSYLEQLFARLRKKSLVKGRRGPGGGYVLAREPEEISIAEIIAAVDDTPAITGQASGDNSVSSDVLWHNLSSQIFSYLGEIKLSQFLQSQSADSSSHEASVATQGWKPEVSYHSRA